MHDQATVELRHAGPFPSPGFALRFWASLGPEMAKEKVNHEIARPPCTRFDTKTCLLTRSVVCVNMLDKSDFTLANLH